MTHAYRHVISVTVAADANHANHAKHTRLSPDVADVAGGSGSQTVAADAGEAGEAEEEMVAPPVPAAFRWRGDDYRVRAVFSSWHLQDRWWEEMVEPMPAASAAAGTPAGAPQAAGGAAELAENRPSDRTYYRLLAGRTDGGRDDELICEIYHDAVSGTWVLERVYD